jgi:hypothetical protein
MGTRLYFGNSPLVYAKPSGDIVVTIATRGHSQKNLRDG